MRKREALFGVCCLLVASCSSAAPPAAGSKPECADNDKKGVLTVFAASSMQRIFKDVKTEYLVKHPCTSDITFSFGSSATLATQIVNGAPADVFVSASDATMTTVQSMSFLVKSPVLFAKNTAEIMVSSKSKFVDTISGLQDLGDAKNPGIRVGLCVSTAPCGALANTVLQKASLIRNDIADSESPSVEDVVIKVELGELDAGIVYHSDCKSSLSSKNTICVDIPPSINSTNSYLAGALNNNENTSDFVSYLASPEFQKYLQSKYGFLQP